MNRRAFLLGAIATPIATKVDAVSAAEIAPLDRPGEPCDARFAGRDQIG